MLPQLQFRRELHEDGIVLPIVYGAVDVFKLTHTANLTNGLLTFLENN